MHTVKLLGDVGHVESQFVLFGDCVTVGAFGDSGYVDARQCTFFAECTIASEIILDAPDGTPR
jgi:hypothetical protein